MAAYRRSHPWCEPCERAGQRIPTQIVDHRMAIRDGGHATDQANMESMCRSCHATKTHTEMGSAS